MLELIRWESAPAPYDVAFATRLGGVSDGPFASLNLGLKTDDELGRVQENRRLLFGAVGVDEERASWPRQVHGADVVRAGSRGVPADGIWSDEPDEPLLVVTADCMPVALGRADGATPALALVHVGWRGLLAGVVEAGVAALGGGRLAAAIGPCIGPCCYEVGEEVAAPYRDAFGADVVRPGRKLDLATAAERALRLVGAGRVDRLDTCTACDERRFFSHRRDAGVTGRQGVVGHVA